MWRGSVLAGLALVTGAVLFTPRARVGLAPSAAVAQADGWHFSDVTAQAGVLITHGWQFGAFSDYDWSSGGATGGDVDGDGDVDLFVVAGDLRPPRLFRNRGNGTFEDVTERAALVIEKGAVNGAMFADLDGEGSLDLVVGGIDGAGPRLFLNNGAGVFREATAASRITADQALSHELGVTAFRETFGASAGDYDGDGDLDLALAHWNKDGGARSHLWRNLGEARFEEVGEAAGIDAPFLQRDFSFTPTFVDITNDGRPDLVYANDFGTSRVFINRGDGTFRDATNPAVITDENGMGSAFGDYDNDGDLDWFVTSIWDADVTAEGNWGLTGNRLYRNRGDGTFEDATEAAGVREGFWGWGSCFADLDLDGNLDIFHVNGFQSFPARQFQRDPSRLFVSNGDGTFRERGAALGVADTLQGRGIVCFDYDNDGDVDLFVNNNEGETRLYRNDGLAGRHWLKVRLKAPGPNTWAVGARVWVRTAAGVQMREVHVGNNYLSTNPIEAHFGLGSARTVDELRIRWPDGTEERRFGVPADQALVIAKSAAQPEMRLAHRRLLPMVAAER